MKQIIASVCVLLLYPVNILFGQKTPLKFDQELMDYYNNYLFLQVPSVYYNHAVSVCLDKQITRGFILLRKAIALEFSDENKLVSEKAFSELKKGTRWQYLLSDVRKNVSTISQLDNFKVVASDITRFASIQVKYRDPEFRNVLMRDYILKGVDGLRSFYAIRIFDPSRLADAIGNQYHLYSSLTKEIPKIESLKPRIVKDMKSFKEIYPNARFPGVYFVVGINNTGGTSTDEGLLIGIGAAI